MKNFADNLVIIIVLYKCSLKESKTFMSLKEAFKQLSSPYSIQLFVYDNSPYPNYEDSFQSGCNESILIKYVNDSSNSGVSKAYNQGVYFAKTINKEWVLLLDQDTSLDPNIFKQFEKATFENSEIKLFAPIIKCNDVIFSPSYYFIKRGWPTKKLWYGIQNFDNKTLINSCMLINVDAFHEVGGYDESVYLDFSDTAFLEKFRKHYNEFFIISLFCFQEASSYQIQPISVISNRYMIFCECAKNFGKNNFFDSVILFTVAFLRFLKLSTCYPKETNIWFRIFRKRFIT